MRKKKQAEIVPGTQYNGLFSHCVLSLIDFQERNNERNIVRNTWMKQLRAAAAAMHKRACLRKAIRNKETLTSSL
jgi:hypothetical protein